MEGRSFSPPDAIDGMFSAANLLREKRLTQSQMIHLMVSRALLAKGFSPAHIGSLWGDVNNALDTFKAVEEEMKDDE